jgi:dTDP-4-amino-4,6-dideoxygalactose transaminase
MQLDEIFEHDLVIPVSLYGNTIDYDNLKVGKGTKVIVDCAQSLGAKYKNKPDGSFGDAAVFSFARNKPIATAGTHGALVWDDDSLTTIIHAVSNNGKLGRDSKIQAYGINAVPMELQAAQIDIGLDHMGEWQVKRKSIHQYYVEQFKNLPLEIIHANDYCESNYHKFALKTNQRNELYKHCQKNNIQALLHYTDNFSDYFGSTKVFPNTDAFCETVITLPNHSWMTDAEIETVANTVKEFYI